MAKLLYGWSHLFAIWDILRRRPMGWQPTGGSGRKSDRLHGLGAEVTVYDPVATGPALAAFPHLGYADSALQAAQDADVLLIATAWPEFAAASPVEIGAVMRRKVLIDACRVTDTRQWAAAGWHLPTTSGEITDAAPALPTG